MSRCHRLTGTSGLIPILLLYINSPNPAAADGLSPPLPMSLLFPSNLAKIELPSTPLYD